jgi:UDP-N-acetylglucosamine 2-epimerase
MKKYGYSSPLDSEQGSKKNIINVSGPDRNNNINSDRTLPTGQGENDVEMELAQENNEFLLLTIHRPENSDNPAKLNMLKNHLEKIRYKIIFPVHPRTKQNLNRFNIQLPSNVKTIDAVGYLEFLGLVGRSKLVLTDSGGLQEEAVVLKKPCITLRHTSARWETILLNANVLFPLDRSDSLSDVVERMIRVKIDRNPYGENVAEKVMDVMDKTIAL